MFFPEVFKESIFSISAHNFLEKSLELFQYQAIENKIYKQYLAHLKVSPEKITKIEDIPFLPISFFKTHKVICGNPLIETVFESSGTTGQITSKHYVSDLKFYKRVTEEVFKQYYGQLSEFVFLTLLPSYAERKGSSLIYMMEHFVSRSQLPQSGFFLYNHEALLEQLEILSEQGKKIILFGATFALLDLSLKIKKTFPNISIIETGGMKGRKKEMIREDVHEILKKLWGLNQIGSEYGMTELLSQAYAIKEGVFQFPSWARVVLRNVNDPFEKGYQIKRGGINVIDLANVNSCAFIETKDLGSMINELSFNVLGRFDDSDVRGCNLLVL